MKKFTSLMLMLLCAVTTWGATGYLFSDTPVSTLTNGKYVLMAKCNHGEGPVYYNASEGGGRYYRIENGTTFNANDAVNTNYIWTLTLNDDGSFTLENLQDSKFFVKDDARNKNFQGTETAILSAEAHTINEVEYFALYLTNNKDDIGYIHANSPGGNPNLSYWNNYNDDGTCVKFLFYPVTEGEVSEPDYTEAYNILSEAGLEVVALKTDSEGEAGNIIANTYAGSGEGIIAHLIDGDTQTFFHTAWSGYATDGTKDYLEVDLGTDNTIKNLIFDYVTRHNAQTDYPTSITIKGSNDKQTYEDIATIDEGLPTGNTKTYVSDVLTNGKEYRYIRFQVNSTTRNQANVPYFHLAEINFYSVADDFENEYLTELTGINRALDNPNKTEATVAAAVKAYNLAPYPNTLAAFTNTKCYTVTTKNRGGWAVNNEGTFVSTRQAGEVAEANKHFAILTLDNENYYLYNIGAEKFVNVDCSTVAGAGTTISFIDASAEGDKRVFVKFNADNGYINLNGSHNMDVCGWNAVDEGNAVLFTPVGDFNSTAALEMLAANVTPNIVINWADSNVAMWGDAITTDFPASVIADANATSKEIHKYEHAVETKKANTITATFLYTGGSCGLNIVGFDIVDASGNIVAGDYHEGFTGGQSRNNVYTVKVPEAGTYTARCYVWANTNDRLNATNGTITIAFEEVETSTFTHNVTFAAEYSTLYLGYKAEIPTGVEAYYITGEKKDGLDNVLMLTPVEGIIPACTAVILKNTSAETTEYTFNYSDATAATIGTNLLKGSIASRYITEEAYVLSAPNNNVGLYKATLNQLESTAFLNNANKAYLVMPAEEASSIASYSFGFDWGGTTGIENIEGATEENATEAIYDITGRQIKAITVPGIYIINGKKTFVK